MIKIAICDNDITITSLIEKNIYNIAKENGYAVEIDVFFDGAQLTKIVKYGTNYDLIYLDIEMNDLNGIDAAHIMREMDCNALIIYISSHEEYMRELFEVEPFRFINKPINIELFKIYFVSACERIEKEQEYFQLKFKNNIEHVSVKEIIYFESEKRYIHIITSKRDYTFYGKMIEIEKSMKKSKYTFIRIHQSYLVNYRHIIKIKLQTVYLDNGQELHISEERQREVRKRFCEIAGGNL